MAYDFTGISSIVDIGGGEGKLLRKILELNPDMRGVVLDVMTGGRERTQAEFCGLLDASEYRLTRIVPTMAPQSVIEAVPK